MNGRSFPLLGFVLATLMLILTLLEARAGPPIWSDNFDSYPTGSNIHGLGGWKGFDNNPQFLAFTTSAKAHSAPNSLDIVGNADLVREFDVDSGLVYFRFYQYIPGSFQGKSYFIMLNAYADGGPYNWSVQVSYDSATGLLTDDGTNATMPFITDQWVEVCISIDLLNDLQAFYYNDTFLYGASWADHISSGGYTSVGAVSLFANGANSIYYDDMTLDVGRCVTRGASYTSGYLPFFTR